MQAEPLTVPGTHRKVLDKQSLSPLLFLFLCDRKKRFCCRGRGQEEEILQPGAWPQEGFPATACDPTPQTVLIPTHLLVLQEGTRKLPTSPPPPGCANHPREGRLPQAPLTVLDAFDQILEVESGLVFGERFEGGHFHHGPERSTRA